MSTGRLSVLLGDALIELIDHRGKTPKKLGGDWAAAGHRVVSAINIKSNRVDDNDHHYVSDELYARWMKVALRAGDVLLTSEAPTGEVAYLDSDTDWCLGQRVFGLRADTAQLLGRYLYYLLRGGYARHQLLARATGTTVSGIRQSELIKVELDLPPLDEQAAVSATLGSLDARILSNERVIGSALALLDALAADVLQRLAASVPLGDLAVVSNAVTSPAVFGEGLVDHFSIPAFDDAAWPERVRASEVKSNKLHVSAPSILISRLNPRFNRTWLSIPDDATPALASTEFLVVSMPEPAQLGALWLAVRDQYFRSELQLRVTGTSGSHQRIRPDDVLAIDVPDVRLMSDGDVSLAYQLLMLTHQRRREIQTLEEVRDSLLPDLLSGRISVRTVGRLAEVRA